MNKEIKTKWLEALRSGKYKQTEGKLRDEKGFCCLGVLCDVVDPSKWKQVKGEEYFIHVEGSFNFLPSHIQDQTYLDETGTFFSQKLEKKSLVGLNDNGKTFLEIADIIEANF